MKKFLSVVVFLAVAAPLARAAEDHPCKAIEQACEQAGFVKGQAKEGTGLWVDCIRPIMTGTAQPAKAKKALPSVDASVVAACKAKRPDFGAKHPK